MAKKSKIKSYLKKLKTTPGVILILAGFVLLATGSFWRLSLNSKETNVQIALIQQNSSYSQPVEISIPSLNINNLPIISGGIENDQWLLADDSVMFLPTSGKPGEGFNTVIYAHNWPSLFGNLKNINFGKQIFIKNKTDEEFVYEVFSIEYVNPQDVSKLESDITNTLTLFTCDGWFDQSRLVVKAKMIPPDL